MRIVTWNVNGFRAVLKKGFLDWLDRADPDVLCLQEIRSDWTDLGPEVRDALTSRWDVCWFPATRKKGYSGTATLTRKALGFSHTPGMGEPDFDAEGRMVQSRRGPLTLLNGYFPNSGPELARLPFKRQFASTLARLMAARTGPLVVVGDMNVAPQPIDLAHPKANEKNAGYTREEREDFQTYLATGMVDAVRHQNPGVTGLYTWWSNRPGVREKNIGWRIDLVLVSPDLVPRVRSTATHAQVMGSDHCPVEVELED